MKKEIWNWTAYLWDCLEVIKNIKDKSINLIVIDPPYNIWKDKKWDKWKTVNEYVEFMWKVFLECQRVLKDNWSFYFFHNDFLQIVELQNRLNKNSKFVFKQLIVWNKRFEWAKMKNYLDWFVAIEQDRNYRLMAEYCLYYTFQDETGLTTVMLDTNNFSTLRKYFKDLQSYIWTKKSILEKVWWKADHCFRWWSSQWDIPTKETYQELINIFWIDKWEWFREYESLRQEYESLRYTFNNQKTHHSVWDYEIAKKQWHITPKPVALIENIIKHSSNEWDLILDCFSWSWTTWVACQNLNRRFIMIEKDENYFNIWIERIKELNN